MANPFDDFFVRIGWDTTAYVKGAKEIEAGQKKARDAAKSSANDMEASAKRAAASFRTVRNEVLGLFLAFQGASSLKAFVGDIITSDAAMGRLAGNLGIGIGRLAGWQGAVEAVGGSAQDAANALQLLVTAQQNLALTGTTGHDADFKRFGITGNDLKNPEEALLKIASVGETMNKPELFARLTRIGFSAPAINLLEKGRKGVADLVSEQEKNANITEKDAKAAQEFEASLAKLKATIVGEFRPGVTQLIEWFGALLDANKDLKLTLPEVGFAFGALALAMAPAVAELAMFVLAALGAINIVRKLRGQEPIVIKIPRFPGMDGESPAADAGGAPGSASGMWNFSSLDKLEGGKGGGGAYADMLIARGIPADKARGIAAGITAEGGTATAFNGAGGGQGAFGIGQWRGSRLKALRARYGRNPSLAQQMDFLTWELRGGDSGMAMALGAGGGSSGAMEAYLRHGMRPGSGLAGDLRRGYAALGGRAPVGGSGSGTTVNIQSMSVNTPNPENFIKKDLPGQLRRHGVILQNSSGMSQ
jgi:hypothetical protein